MELKRLIEIARIQSTESSNRIEGIVTTNPRLKQLMDDKTTPRNRDEEEILGYRNVLALVHEDYNAIPAGSDDCMSESRKLLRGISPKKLVEDGTLTRWGAERKTHYVRSDAAL